MEVFSSQGDGTLTVIKESSPTSFAVEQTVTTPINTPTGGLTTVTAQLTTQVNPFPGVVSSGSIVAEQQVAIIGPVYYSPGGILNVVGPANSNLTTGGGP